MEYKAGILLVVWIGLVLLEAGTGLAYCLIQDWFSPPFNRTIYPWNSSLNRSYLSMDNW